MPFLSEGGLPSPGGKQPDTELERKEYEIIFFLAWFQYLNCDLMAWMEVNPVFLTGLTFLIAWMGVSPGFFLPDWGIFRRKSREISLPAEDKFSCCQVKLLLTPSFHLKLCHQFNLDEMGS